MEKQIKKELINLNIAQADKTKTLDEASETAIKELKELKEFQIVSETKYQDLALRYGHIFEAGIGAEAIRNLLKTINLKKLGERFERCNC